MFEWLTPGFAYNVLKDVAGWRRRRKRSPEERLAAVEKWAGLFEEEIYRCRTEKLRQDVIIHDAGRLEDYPNSAKGRGISPWFRVDLVDQYHRGIEVALSIHSLVFEESEKQWRIADYSTEESINGFIIGYIPYESIVSVSWHGDEYYYFPHIFVHFEHRGKPYEKVMFCERSVASNGKEFFTPLASVADVRRTSQKFGTAKFAWVS
ncbi:MAG TPA: hypothetical protein VMG08_00975 [Allosphingosinicella sp.]|nr:hypothetical protein [Allosphingosinicella sp.]